MIRLNVTFFSLTKQTIKYVSATICNPTTIIVYATNVGTLAEVTMFVTQPLIGRHVSTAHTVANGGAGLSAQY